MGADFGGHGRHPRIAEAHAAAIAAPGGLTTLTTLTMPAERSTDETAASLMNVFTGHPAPPGPDDTK